MLLKFFTSPLLRNLLLVLLLLAIASGLGYLATRYSGQRDITHNASNSLEPASVEVLRQLSGPGHITGDATGQDPRPVPAPPPTAPPPPAPASGGRPAAPSGGGIGRGRGSS